MSCEDPTTGSAIDGLPLPERIDRFRIHERIGGGSFGIVYRAHDPESGRDVALKVIQVTTERTRRRYLAESEALQTLADDTFAWCPRFVAAGAGDVTAWIAMELIEGGAIDEYCDAERLDELARVRLFRTACLGVESAHNRGILHLDLKPEHILVQQAGAPDGGPAPRLIDLGLARGMYFNLGPRGSTHGEGRGTPGYMGPEITDGRIGDPRSDVYSLGAVLYLLLSGCRPRDQAKTGEYAGQTPPHRFNEMLPLPDVRFADLSRRGEGATAILAARATTAKALIRFLRGDVGRIVMRALHPEPNRRYQSPAELADDLGRFLEHRPIATRGDRVYRARLFLRRNHRWLGVFAGAIAALFVVILLLDQNLAQAKDNERLASERQRAIAESLLRDGEAAAQRGKWNQALALYDQARQVGGVGASVWSLDLGIRRVEALEASYRVDAARALLAELERSPDAEARRAKLLLLACDLGVSRLQDPEANLELAREALAIVERNPSQLANVEVEYLRAVLAATPREAFACLRRAREHDASNYRVNINYAMGLLMMGERDEAFRFASAFQALNPEDEEAHYLATAMTALGQQPSDSAVREVCNLTRVRFGGEAGDAAEAIAEGMSLLGWGNQLMRETMAKTDTSLARVVATFTHLHGRLFKVTRALAERQEGRTSGGGLGGLLRIPPAIARDYRPLFEAVAQRPIRPQNLAKAVQSMNPTQHDGMLIHFAAMALVIDGQQVAALNKVAEALQAKSAWLDRRTALLFGCMLGTKVLREDPTAPDHVRPLVLPWLREAARREDWSPAEMVILFDDAASLDEHDLAITMAHFFHFLAPSEAGVTAIYAQALLMCGAAKKADAVLTGIEPGLADLTEPSKGRVLELRAAIDRVLKK